MTTRPPRPCGNPKCSVSTTIAETLSFGSGCLDENGIFEFPCVICAQFCEKRDRKDKVNMGLMPYFPRNQQEIIEELERRKEKQNGNSRFW